MKRIIYQSCLWMLVIVLGTSCDKGFDDLNTNKVNPLQIDPLYQLNNAVVSASYPPSSSLSYDIGVVQQIISPNNGVLNGANFNSDNRPNTQVIWQNYYRNVIRNTHDVLVNTDGVADRANLRQMARIFQAFAYMVLTDEYGDIPYKDGAKGYSDQNFFPVYDAQQEVYTDIIVIPTPVFLFLPDVLGTASADTRCARHLHPFCFALFCSSEVAHRRRFRSHH